MIIVLYTIGIIFLIVSVIYGFAIGGVPGVTIAISGIISSILYFALAKILGNQEEIFRRLNRIEEAPRRLMRQNNKKCENCGSSYDNDMHSCPHCGHKE